MPVSSRVSRMAAWGRDSPMSTTPPGSAQLSLSVRRISRTSPTSLVTTTLTDGTMRRACGASGSLWKSILRDMLLVSRNRCRGFPDPFEAVQVDGRELAAGDLAQVPQWCAGCGHALNVGVDQELVVAAVDRVVQDRLVQAELGARHLAQRPVEDHHVADLRGHGLVDALVGGMVRDLPAVPVAQ